MNPTNDEAVGPGGRRVVDLDTGGWQVCEAAIRQFEAAWQSGPPPISDYLPADEPLRSAVLWELVQIDLELRQKRGERAELESYVRQFPELAGFDVATVG